MKSAFLLWVAIFFPLMISAQVYHPVLRDTMSWEVFEHMSSPTCDYVNYGRYVVAGDTTIQNEQYRIIRPHPIIGTNMGGQCPPYYVDLSTLDPITHFLREDTTTKQLIHYDWSTNMESVLYDFSLESGDTLPAPFGGYHLIDTVVDIVLLNGQVRKQFILDQGLFFYIEGIGGSTGIGNFFEIAISWGIDLTCVRDGETSLLDGTILPWNSCHGPVEVEEIHNTFEIEIGPNPTSGLIQIRRQQTDRPEFRLVALSGKEVFNSTLVNSTETIDLTHLPAGAYIYDLDGQYRGKLILTD